MVLSPTASIISTEYFNLSQEVFQKGGYKKSHPRMLSASEGWEFRWEMKVEII